LEVSVDEVVKINAGESILLEEEEEEPKPKKAEARPVIAGTPSLIIVRDQQKDYQFWIVNPSSDEILFTAYYRVREKYRPLNAASVPPQDRFFLGRLPSQDFHNANQVHVTILRYVRAGRIRPAQPFTLEIKAKKDIFNQRARYIAEVDAEGYEFVFEEKKEKVVLPDSDFVRVKPEQKSQPNPEHTVVVDLHIHRLVSNPASIDTRMMMEIQMEHFERKLADARLNKVQRVVFIHGIGSGQLRKRIHDELRRTEWVHSFSNADPVKYANGATLVELES